jgi:hypothetical protein
MQCDDCRAFHKEDHHEPPPCETDSEYECYRAKMRDNPLTPGNELASIMYGRIANQLMYDFHLAPFTLESYGYFCGGRETNRLIEKLSIIHAVKSAKKKESQPGEDDDPDGPEFG